MRARIRGIFAAAAHLTVVVASAATVILRPSTANATVDYVKICSLFGAGFFYLPGTDICVNFEYNDAREAAAGTEYLVSELPPTCSSPSTLVVSDDTDSDCTAGSAPVGGGSTSCEVACVSGAWKIIGDGFTTWRWRIPNNPRTWVRTPQDGCQGGQLVKFGDINSSNLTLNAQSRYETNKHYPLNLKPGQYIASVLYKGGFTVPRNGYSVSSLPACPSPNTFVTDANDPSCPAGGTPAAGGTATCEVACVSGAWQFTGSFDSTVGQGNFCMFYYYLKQADITGPDHGPRYSFPLGCIDTSAQASVPATLAFSPDSPIPPAVPYQTYILGANGDPWEVNSAADIQGTLSVWLCLQNTPHYGPGH